MWHRAGAQYRSSAKRLDVLLLDRGDPPIDTPFLFEFGGVRALGDRGADDRREDDVRDEERELRSVDDPGVEAKQRRDRPERASSTDTMLATRIPAARTAAS